MHNEQPTGAADGVQDCGAVSGFRVTTSITSTSMFSVEELCRLHALGEHGSHETTVTSRQDAAQAAIERQPDPSSATSSCAAR
jgi:hypothetical protein